MNFNQLTRSATSARAPKPSNYRTEFPLPSSRSPRHAPGRTIKANGKTKPNGTQLLPTGRASRKPLLVSSNGAHLFVQGELTTREYDRTIQVPAGKKTIEHVIQQTGCRTKGGHHPPSRSRQQLRCESSACSQQRRCPPLRGTHPRICTVPDETALASQAYSATPSRPSTVLCAPTLFFRTDRCPVVS